jgi:hypothetical protein
VSQLREGRKRRQEGKCLFGKERAFAVRTSGKLLREGGENCDCTCVETGGWWGKGPGELFCSYISFGGKIGGSDHATALSAVSAVSCAHDGERVKTVRGVAGGAGGESYEIGSYDQLWWMTAPEAERYVVPVLLGVN